MDWILKNLDRHLDGSLSFRARDSAIAGLETLMADDVGQGACQFVEGQFHKKTFQCLIICMPASDKGKTAGT